MIKLNSMLFYYWLNIDMLTKSKFGIQMSISLNEVVVLQAVTICWIACVYPQMKQYSCRTF